MIRHEQPTGGKPWENQLEVSAVLRAVRAEKDEIQRTGGKPSVDPRSVSRARRRHCWCQ